MQKMLDNIYFSITLPDRDECVIGILSVPNNTITVVDDHTGQEVENIKSIFSIGLFLLRIDIIY